MLASLHTYRTVNASAAFAANFTLPANPVLADILSQLPTAPDGFYTAVEFESPIPADAIAAVEAAFSVPYAPVEDSFLVDTRDSCVRIYADNLRGLIYGAYTLLQDARESADGRSVGRGLLYDRPRCPFRGLKVYMPAPDDLASFYRTVDLLCSLRYNTLIVEVGGAMEYRRHPEINAAWIDYCTEMNRYPERADEVQNRTFPWAKNSIHFENGGGKWLSQDTVRDLIRYCRARGMEVIPECPTLSHADYLLMAHPELAERKDDTFPDVYCPSNPDTYKLVFDVLDEVIDVFQPKIMHIGHDEYYSIGICPRCKGKSGEEIYAADINKIYGYLKARGIRTMLWSEKLIDAIGTNGVHYGGSELRRRHPDGSIEIVRPATWRAIDIVPRDIIAHHWYWSLAEYYDDEYNKRGIPLWYGNFEPVGFLDWNRRLSQGAQGGSPSHWSSLEDATLQRNGVFLSLFYGTLLFWDEHYDDARFPEYIKAVFEEMFFAANRRTLEGPHFAIVHTTTIRRPYQYLSSVPMQLTRDTIGYYEVRYEDGDKLEIPIVYGLNITNKSRSWERVYQGDSPNSYGVAERDTYAFDSLLREVSYTTLPTQAGADTGFKIVVPNPHPEKRVISVRTVKTAADEGDILLASFIEQP
ncbi:MAG: family 20 glycosylhydrolase [Clostridiaceae bacterium]|nr:family 20 glycosylhydrolase [Clostridiaceae bacterium]